MVELFLPWNCLREGK
jgi:hypothetical protein